MLTDESANESGKTFVELFAGIGLVHEALRQLGWHPVLANDNDPRKVRAYKANYPEVPFNEREIGRASCRERV